MKRRKINKVKLVQQVLDVLDKCRIGTQTYADTTRATTQLRRLELLLKKEAKVRTRHRKDRAENAMHVNRYLHGLGY
jgi:hypothetical protein